MKATIALAVANAILAAATPLQERAYVTQLDIKTVTQYVYPDGSPATHLGGAKPTEGAAVTYETVTDSAPSSSAPEKDDKPSQSQPEQGATKPSEGGSDSGSGSGQENGADVGSVQQASINAHNAHRSNHTCEQVEWDTELAKYAQQLADTCSYGHDTKIGGGGYGQNIAMGAQSNFQLTEGQAAARAITRQWYNNEFELYPSFGSEPSMDDFESWGHLSQILWKDTKKIGCAIALCDGGELAAGMDGYFAVCNYSPAGNVAGKYATNVLPATGGAKVLQA